MRPKGDSVLDMTVFSPEDAGISAVAGIRAELLEAIGKASRGTTVQLDLSRATKADSALAQLIISSKAEAAAKGIKLTIKTPGDELSILSLLSCDSMDEKGGGTA